MTFEHWFSYQVSFARAARVFMKCVILIYDTWLKINLKSLALPVTGFCVSVSALMAFDSFRDFVNALDKAGELKRISQPVATELEITEIADREMKSPGGGKALLFEKPTVNGEISPFPLAINTMGSARRM